MEGNVYDLPSYFASSPIKPKYLICRNTLHRFRDVREALHQMYSTIEEGGSIYLRDLKRNADWKTIVRRIGEERWKSDRLVRDYVGAMAQMLTTDELGNILQDTDVDTFTFCPSEYSGSQESFEYGRDVEYTCVVKKD